MVQTKFLLGGFCCAIQTAQTFAGMEPITHLSDFQLGLMSDRHTEGLCKEILSQMGFGVEKDHVGVGPETEGCGENALANCFLQPVSLYSCCQCWNGSPDNLLFDS